jgi:exopolysaccharide biosynthesis protein
LLIPKERSRKKLKKPWPKWFYKSTLIISFILFQVFFGVITFPLLVFYGPFTQVRDSLVGAAMTTLSHQYIATFFLSDAAVSEIMGNNVVLDLEEIDFEPEKDLVRIDKSKMTNHVQVFNVDGGNFQGKLIKIDDPRRVVVGYTAYIPKAGETTSSIGKRSNAIAAINAGGFVDEGFTGTGGAPLGFIIHDGQVVYNQVKRDDVLQDTIAFDKDGRMIVGRYTMKRLMEMEVKEGVSFGPPLIVNGKPTITSGDGGWGVAPRTAIGQTKDGSVLFLVVDGRTLRSVGARLVDIQDILFQHGAVTAANLDGGSSTTMYYNGKVINHPSDSLGERTVPTTFMALPKASLFRGKI